jgi:hypothetical protein
VVQGAGVLASGRGLLALGERAARRWRCTSLEMQVGVLGRRRLGCRATRRAAALEMEGGGVGMQGRRSLASREVVLVSGGGVEGAGGAASSAGGLGNAGPRVARVWGGRPRIGRRR